MKVYKSSIEIKSWLLQDVTRTWVQLKNTNCFTSNRLEALYIYKDHVKYYEDVRHSGTMTKHPIPENKDELYNIICSKPEKKEDL